MMKWETVRFFCVLSLYIGLIFCQTDWCEREKSKLDASCNRNASDDIEYFNISLFELKI